MRASSAAFRPPRRSRGDHQRCQSSSGVCGCGLPTTLVTKANGTLESIPIEAPMYSTGPSGPAEPALAIATMETTVVATRPRKASMCISLLIELTKFAAPPACRYFCRTPVKQSITAGMRTTAIGLVLRRSWLPPVETAGLPHRAHMTHWSSNWYAAIVKPMMTPVTPGCSQSSQRKLSGMRTRLSKPRATPRAVSVDGGSYSSAGGFC